MANLNKDDRRRLAELAKSVLFFDRSDWQRVGIATGCLDIVRNHPRLLRAIRFGDEDVPEAASEVIWQIAETDFQNISTIEEMISEKQSGFGENISTTPSKNRLITFTPSVFELPETGTDPNLIAVMMPFQHSFEPVFNAIKAAANAWEANAVRASDIWDHQVIIQDIFSLIFRAKIVVCDFTGRNPNVFYEAGIAHSLGKLVIPITQSKEDIPFDIQHHRYVHYLNNGEGLEVLRQTLQNKFFDELEILF